MHAHTYTPASAERQKREEISAVQEMVIDAKGFRQLSGKFAALKIKCTSFREYLVSPRSFLLSLSSLFLLAATSRVILREKKIKWLNGCWTKCSMNRRTTFRAQFVNTSKIKAGSLKL
jgi:hypothetical protein